MKEMEERKYYMVRAMQSLEEDFEVFFKNSVVAVGWREVDFSSFSKSDELRKSVNESYYVNSTIRQQFISRRLNEVERFKNMKENDYVIVPFNSYIVLAEVEENETFSKEDYERDLANQRSVSYRYKDGKILKISRKELSEGLQRRLRVPGSCVSDLFEFGKEIEDIFNSKSYSYSQEMMNLEQEEMDKFKAELLNNIQSGKTNLQTGGIGLENLVYELMKCEGYNAEVLAKNKFAENADADVRAIKEDSFMSKKILAQVKHHSGNTGKLGILQIINVLEEPEYQDYDGLLITSGMISDELRDFAIKSNIDVMDGISLVELIINNLNILSEPTKRQLGISIIPHLISTNV